MLEIAFKDDCPAGKISLIRQALLLVLHSLNHVNGWRLLQGWLHEKSCDTHAMFILYCERHRTGACDLRLN